MTTERIELIVEGKDQNATGVLSSVQGAAGKLGGVFKGALVGGAGIAIAGIGGLAAVLGSSVKEAMAAEEVSAQLAAVLKSTGGAAGVTATMAQDLANNLSEVTRFEDDAVLSGENMLLTFTNVGKDVFPDATEAMLDMSTAMGQDLKSSAIQIGKALNDPIEGISALSRVGVAFTDQQKEMIKAMVEAGDTAGAQKIILAELNKEFGGAAQAAGGTFAGQMDILKNKLGNVKESIGNALLPVLTDLAVKLGPGIVAAAQKFADWLTTKAIPALQQFGNWIQTKAIPALQKLGNWIQTNVVPALQAFGNWIQTKAIPALQALGNWIQTNVVPALQAFGNWIQTQAIPALQQLGNWIQTNVVPALQALGNWIQTNVVPALQQLGEFIATKVFPALQQFGQFIQIYVVPVLNTLAQFVGTVVKLAFEALATAWDLFLKPALQALWNFIQTYVVPVLQKLADFIRKNAGPAFEWLNLNVIQPIVATIKDFAQKIENAITWLRNVRDELNITLPDPFAALAGAVQNVIGFVSGLISKIEEALRKLRELVGGGGGGGGGNSEGRGRSLDTDGGRLGLRGSQALAPITINVYTGAGSPEMVRRAANMGVVEALRARGYW